MQAIRTFIAVEVSAEVRARASKLIERLRESGAKVNWVETQNMHLTLKFLGDVPNTRVADVCSAVSDAAREVEPFAVEYHGAGAFPDVRRARTVWIGVRAGEEQVAVLQKRIDKALGKLGFSKERRRFHSHLTIGRVRQGGPEQRALSELIQQNADFVLASAPVEEVLVFASFLDKTGPTYEVLGRAPLAG